MLNQSILKLKNASKILLILFLIIFNSPRAYSAEILQINNSNSLLIGEQNRNLTIQLFCVDVNDNDEEKAVNLLKQEFPRGSKVKIKPYAFKENILIAKVFNVEGTKEMSDLLISRDLTQENCVN